jgi:hypothetical protein
MITISEPCSDQRSPFDHATRVQLRSRSCAARPVTFYWTVEFSEDWVLQAQYRVTLYDSAVTVMLIWLSVRNSHGSKTITMSRRTAIVEEFDDDTDLPLPSRPLPDRGMHGPVLQELHISDDEFEPTQNAGPASQPQQRFQPSTGADKSSASGAVTDITPYKKYVLDSFVDGRPMRLFSQMDVCLSHLC